MHSETVKSRDTVKAECAADKNSAALMAMLQPLEPFLQDPTTTEIVINRPGELFTESNAGWVLYKVEELTEAYLRQLARVSATYSKQKVDAESPILSCTFPTGERVQIVISPVMPNGMTSVTIRKPSEVNFTLNDYYESGAFSACKDASADLLPFEQQLIELKEQRKFLEFIDLAVKQKQNIIVSGATGSGKTTFTKAIIQCIPTAERLLSVENVDELRLWKSHRNSVGLFYSAGGQGLAKVGPKELMESALRMKPDRVLLAELIRGEEAFYFLRNVGSGHPGSITTMHGNTCKTAIEQLVTMMKECTAGASMTRDELRGLIYACVDIVIQFKKIDGVRKISEIYYDPKAKKQYIT